MNNNNEYMTGYKVAKVVNELLALAGIKPIPPQMVYNYISKGYISSMTVDGQKLVHIDDAAAWADAYVAKKLSSK